jgi:hypothetical protein
MIDGICRRLGKRFHSNNSRSIGFKLLRPLCPSATDRGRRVERTKEHLSLSISGKVFFLNEQSTYRPSIQFESALLKDSSFPLMSSSIRKIT